jgi:hypothetical protein
MTPELLEQFARKIKLQNSPVTSKSMAYCCSNDEAIVLYATALQHRPAAIFECGTAVGWSSMWLAAGANSDEHHRHVERTGWDTPVYSFDLTTRPQHFMHHNVQKIIGDYSEKINSYAHQWLGFSKLFFIDGDHSLAGIRKDWDATESVVEPGDKIIFHDVILERGSRRFDEEFQAKFPNYRRELYRTYNGIVVYTAT